MKIVMRQRLLPRDDLRHALQARQQSHERPLDLEDDGRSPRRQERRVADELNGIAEALLGMQQDRLAVEQFLAAPKRRAVVTPLRGEPAHMPA